MRYLMLSISLLLAHSVYADTAIITHSNVVEAVPTIETSAYASGDVIGEKLSLSDAARSLVSTGIISSVVIVDKDSEAVDIDVVFFDANPAAFGNDNAAFDPTDADVANIVCVVSVTDYYTFNDNSVGIAQNVNCPFDLGSTNTTLYAALVSRGTPTYTAATDLTLRVGILQD